MRLGSRVTLIERALPLPAEEREQADLLLARLRQEGVEILSGSEAVAVAEEGAEMCVTLARGVQREAVRGSHLLVAVGRRTAFDDLEPEKAGVEVREGRLVLDRRLRTTNRRIYAAGDAAGGPQFTHLAGAHAGVLIKNIAFRLPAKADGLVVPRVTYTDPELAAVGLGEAEARERGHAVTLLRWPFHENDRAQAEHATAGFVKAVVGRRGKILGASILGPHAGELLQPWVLAMERGLPISTLATTLQPYPTLGEVSKRAAGSFYAPKLFSKRTRALVALLKRLG